MTATFGEDEAKKKGSEKRRSPESARTIAARKRRAGRTPIVMLTAYDACIAGYVARSGVDLILVGDSVGTTQLGYASTIPVTMDEMLHHVRAVVRGAPDTMVVADMPYGADRPDAATAVRNGIRFLKETGAHAVKLEGGSLDRREAIAALVSAGVPVMAHLGLLPQSLRLMGGYRVQGRTPEDAERIFDEALKVAEAGAFSLVLEGVPASLAHRITEAVEIPTIGIGAGPGTDGQVLVVNDLLGLSSGKYPKFVRRYAELGKAATEAIERYADDVRESRFPGEEESYP